MFAEEQFLRKKFGNIYLEWAEKTPAFIPKFKNFNKNTHPFSWKKVLKKEKNGLFALFLIFCVLNVSGVLIEHERDFNYFLIVMCLLTAFNYIVLKVLKTKTHLLDDI